MKYRVLALIISGFVLFSCATLKEITNIQKPLVSVDEVKLTDLNFDSLSLMFDIGIENPNQLSIKLNGFDYQFLLDEKNFLNGQQNEEIQIKSLDKNSILLPVTLNFKEIYQSYQAIKDKDSVLYRIKVGLSFDLPVLGNTRIPVETSGDIPLLKLPSLSISSLKLKQFSFTGASLELALQLKNPNPISLISNNLNYQLMVEGKEWISGGTQTPQKMQANNTSLITLPVTLNFLQMGQSVYQMVTGNSSLNYQFKGTAAIGSDHPLLKTINLPFNESGDFKIQK